MRLFAAFVATLLASWALAVDNPAEFLPGMARELGTPLVADFGMNRCSQCIRQSAAVEVLSEETKGKVHWEFVNIGKQDDVREASKVILIPTLIFFDAKGVELFRNVGLMEVDDLREKLKELGLI